MPLPSAAKPQRLLRFRPLHGVLLLAALVAPLVLTSLAGAAKRLSMWRSFPLAYWF
ncbi:hypothetical protein P4544_07350 [Halomonas sp. LY9]